MKIKALIFLIITSLFISLLGCTNQTINSDIKDSKIAELQDKIDSYEKNINDLQEKINSYELEKKYLKEENDGYKKFINSSLEYLNSNDLLELAKKEWKYSISVDEKPIEPNAVLEIDKSNFKITYSETQSAFTCLPADIHNKGSISGNFLDHLKILDIEPNSIQQTDGTVVQGMTYEFKNLHKGTAIAIEISNELKERLSLKSNRLTIYVK